MNAEEMCSGAVGTSYVKTITTTTAAHGDQSEKQTFSFRQWPRNAAVARQPNTTLWTPPVLPRSRRKTKHVLHLNSSIFVVLLALVSCNNIVPL